MAPGDHEGAEVAAVLLLVPSDLAVLFAPASHLGVDDVELAGVDDEDARIGAEL